jgi:hypothetical protein
MGSKGYDMPIFQEISPGLWAPSAMAAGPFKGLQGGAVAGLLTAEIEALAAERQWGRAVSSAAWFLRPVPMAKLRSSVTVIQSGGRVSIIDNALRAEGETEISAMVRVTLIRERAIDVPGFLARAQELYDPTVLPRVLRPAPHGKPWFMDTMDVHPTEGMVWFRLKESIVINAGPLAQAMGPADWAHGISRPISNVIADPNPNLTVHLIRRPQSEWIAVQSQTTWEPEAGMGMGSGLLRDLSGNIGVVSMAVALTPFPKATH